jgi:PIN like domain
LSFVYFTDRDLGKRFPEILRSGGLTVERHADHFAADTADEVWLKQVGRRGWIALPPGTCAAFTDAILGALQLRIRCRGAALLLVTVLQP